MGYGHAKLGEVAVVRGQTVNAFAAFDTALDMLRRSGDRPHEAEALRARADCHVIAGDLTDALNTYDTALTLAINHQARRVEVEARLGAALVHALQGAVTTALELATEATEKSRVIGDPTLGTCAQCILAIIRILNDELDSAEQLITESRALATRAMPRSRVIVALADAFLTLGRGSAEDAAEQLGTIRTGSPDTPSSESWYETQVIDRLIRSKLPVDTAVQAMDPDADIRVSASGFSVGDGEWTDLSKKDLLCRFLHVLVEAQVQTPGEAIKLDALIECLWPDERMLRDAGATRVYTAVANLRRMGLRKLLLRRSGGYLLEPSAKIARLDR